MKQLGNDKQLWIQTAVAGTFNVLAGQRTLKRGISKKEIDIGDKNSQGYDLMGMGNRAIKITLDGVVDLPDANGVERAYMIDKANTTEVFQIRQKPYGNTDIVYQALSYVSFDSFDEPRDGESAYSLSLSLAAVPTVDLIGK